MIDGTNVFGQRIKNDIRTYDNGSLLDYFSNEHYELIGRVFNKQQELDAGQKTIQRINFTGNLDQEIQ